MPGGSVVSTLTQKRAVFPAFSSCEITIGQMRKIGIHFIIYQEFSYYFFQLAVEIFWWTRSSQATFIAPNHGNQFQVKLCQVWSASHSNMLTALSCCSTQDEARLLFLSPMDPLHQPKLLFQKRLENYPGLKIQWTSVNRIFTKTG